MDIGDIDQIPVHMRQRTWKQVHSWFLRFGIDLEAKIIEQCSNEGAINLLDLGCGSGNTVKDVAQKIPILANGIIHGIDVCEHTQWEGISSSNPSIHLLKADAQDMTIYLDNSMDFIYSMALLGYPPDVFRVIQEIYRILKPGKNAYLYAMLGIKKLSNPSLDTLMIDYGMPFKTHSFTQESIRSSRTGFYPEGCILEIQKTGNPTNIALPLLSNSPAITYPSDDPDRLFEKLLTVSNYITQ